jgi:hypothetical protein
MMRRLAAVLFIGVFQLISNYGFCAVTSVIISFGIQRGYYEKPFTLTLSTNNPAATIVYTTDCSIPTTTNGKVYHSGIEISTNTIVKAIAYYNNDTSILETHTYLFIDDIKKQGKNPAGFPSIWGGSSTISADYEMDPWVVNHSDYSDKIIQAFKSLPSLSLSMPIHEWFDPKTGLYVGYPNSSETREKAVSAEFIYAGNTGNFGLNCGVQNQGGTSIVNWKVPKQSMRLLFKEQYGPKKLKTKLFPDSDIESINTLVLDGMLYSWVHPFDKTQCVTSLYFRDQLCSDVQNAMGGLSFHGIYVNLFINGLYWGMYDLHERPDEDFMAEYYDAETTDFDIIKHNPNTIVAGTNKSYKDLLTVARTDFSAPESLEKLQRHLDLPAFIDYMILNYFLGNSDWAHQNYYAATNLLEGSGYRFYTWDAEHVMRYSDVNFDATKKMDTGGPTEIHASLKKNSEYRMMFADAFYKHAFNEGALSNENFEALFLYRKNEIDQAIILESARWGDFLRAQHGVTYTRNDHWLPEANKVIASYIPQRRDVVIKQLQRSDNLLYPKTLPPVLSKYGGMVKKGESIEIQNPNTTLSNIFYTFDGTDPRKPTGMVNQVKDKKTVQINNTTLIKARVLNSATNEWSPLVECLFIPENTLNRLIICEIMYNLGDNILEFIELMNTGHEEINLYGVSFSKGIDYTFNQNRWLKTGERIVLTNDMVLFENLYAFKAYDVYAKNLSNKGETLILTDYFKNTIDSVSFSDSAPWPKEADGAGRSLELISTDSDNALASSWRASLQLYGSPEYYNPNGITNQPFISAELRVYPNPASNWLTIAVQKQEPISEVVLIEIFTLSGQQAKTIKQTNIEPISTLNIADLQPGVYQLRLRTGSNGIVSKTAKFIKIN